MKFPGKRGGLSGPDMQADPPRLDWLLLNPVKLFAFDNAFVESECRRMAVATFVGDQTVLCRTLGRFKMYVSTLDEGLAPHLIGDGYWEMWTTRAMVEMIKPGMVCLDAGANVGYYSVLMADLAGSAGRVVAAEPVPATRRLLQRNVSINGFTGVTDILDNAFGAKTGEVTLYIPPGEPKNALICDHVPHPDWDKITAPISRIDDLDLARVDVVKIDVEGAEMDVWKGMQNTIDKNPDIQILMEVNCGRYPQAAKEFLAAIESRFPLRQIDFTGCRVKVDANAVIAYPDDVMLYLSRS